LQNWSKVIKERDSKQNQVRYMQRDRTCMLRNRNFIARIILILFVDYSQLDFTEELVNE